MCSQRLVVAAVTIAVCLVCSSQGKQLYEDNKQLNCYGTNGSSTLGYSCNGARNSCASYLTFRSSSPYYRSPVYIAYLLAADASNISVVNAVTDVSLVPAGDLVLVPANCSCSAAAGGYYYQHNASYTLKFTGETYQIVANNTYQGLTACQALIAQNPAYESRNLTAGDRLDVPLRCACPTAEQQARRGTRYLLSYLVTWGDNVETIAGRFGVDAEAVLEANSLTASSTIYPFTTLLIPLATVPTTDQLALFNSDNSPPPPPPPSSTGPPPGSGGGGGVFIGVGVGAGVVAVLAVLLVWWFRRRRRHRKASLLPVAAGSAPSSFLSPDATSEAGSDRTLLRPADRVSAQSIRVAIGSLKVYEFHELEEATGSFSEDHRIKGSVYKGVINGDKAAIKRLKVSDAVSSEISILKQINHSNVIRLSGVCLHEGSTYLVYEFAENGSLEDRLHQDKVSGADHGKDDGSDATYAQNHLTWKQRVQIAHDVADALNYLHNYSLPSYVHLNLNSGNVLLDAGHRGKLANFSLARAIHEGDEGAPLTRHVIGTHGYMAPEYLEDGLISPKLDVFAFGVVLLELLSGKEAAFAKEGEEKRESLLWASIGNVLGGEDVRSKLRAFVDRRLQDDYSFSLAFSMAELAMKCVARQPGSRPSMTEVLLSLSAIYNSTLDWDPSDFTNSYSGVHGR